MKRFTETYKSYAGAFTDAPEIFHEFVSYWLISNVLQRNIYLRQGHQNVFANLWLCLLAPSSLFHKSYALSIAQDILDQVLPGFILPHEWSSEKLVELLQKQPCGTFIYDEFASLLGHMGRDYAMGTQALLTSLYGGSTYRRVTGMQAEKTFEVKETFINIAAASTLSWFKRTARADDMAGGFLPRFLLVPEVERKKLMPFQPPANMEDRSDLVNMLCAMKTVRGEARYNSDAEQAFVKFYTDFVPRAETKGESLQPFLARLIPYVHKLSLILAVDRGEFPEITLQAFTQAKFRIEFLANRLEEVIIRDLASSPFQQKVRRVENLIRSKNSSGITVSEVLRNADISSREWKDIKTTLEESDLVSVVSEPTKTKPKSVVYWTGEH